VTGPVAHIQLPNDPAIGDALTAFFQAVALGARRRELVARAEATIGEADEEVRRTFGALVAAGAVPKLTGGTATRRPRVTPGTSAEPAEGTVIARCIAAVHGGASTAPDVARAAGTDTTRAAGALLEATNRGLVARVKTTAGWVYSPPPPGQDGAGEPEADAA